MIPLKPHAVEASTTDGHVLTTVDGQSVWAPLAIPNTALVPLTTVVNGIPELVWESDNSLALTEVPR